MVERSEIGPYLMIPFYIILLCALFIATSSNTTELYVAATSSFIQLLQFVIDAGHIASLKPFATSVSNLLIDAAKMTSSDFSRSHQFLVSFLPSRLTIDSIINSIKSLWLPHCINYTENILESREHCASVPSPHTNVYTIV